MSFPIVALTASTKKIDGLMRVRLNEAYVNAVREAGMVPLVVPPLDPSEIAPIMDAVAGLVLTGGEDVAPAEYGAETAPETTDVHARRDKCELAMLQAARDRRMPTLAICRGLQVVNVGFGGTLVQDIPRERPSEIRHDLSERRTERVHDVSVDADSKLAAVLGATGLRVNSSHHQALDRVAKGIRVVSRSPDGIIEGAEWTADDWWMVGVQWHPEELTRDSQLWDRNLFRAFAEEIGVRKHPE